MKKTLIVILVYFLIQSAYSREFVIEKDEDNLIVNIKEFAFDSKGVKSEINTWVLKKYLANDFFHLHWNCNEEGRSSRSTISPANPKMMKYIAKLYVIEESSTASGIFKSLSSGKWENKVDLNSTQLNK